MFGTENKICKIYSVFITRNGQITAVQMIIHLLCTCAILIYVTEECGMFHDIKFLFAFSCGYMMTTFIFLLSYIFVVDQIEGQSKIYYNFMAFISLFITSLVVILCQNHCNIVQIYYAINFSAAMQLINSGLYLYLLINSILPKENNLN